MYCTVYSRFSTVFHSFVRQAQKNFFLLFCSVVRVHCSVHTIQPIHEVAANTHGRACGGTDIRADEEERRIAQKNGKSCSIDNRRSGLIQSAQSVPYEECLKHIRTYSTVTLHTLSVLCNVSFKLTNLTEGT